MRRERKHTASVVASYSAKYSATVVEVATVAARMSSLVPMGIIPKRLFFAVPIRFFV